MIASKTYPCYEHGEVAVPITELVVEGEVEVYPEVTGHGYFDIDFRRGELLLIAKSFVGLIPINPRVCIHVMPRLPVDNILYLVQRANKALQYLPGYFRSYKVERLTSGNPEEFFASSLLECLIEVKRNGLMHRYVSRDTDRGWRGRILLASTVGRFISKGIRYQQVRQLTELSADIPENRITKDMLSHVIRYFSQFSDKRSKEIGSQAATLYQIFDRVSNLSGGKEEIARQALRYIRGLPGDHKAYERILWLCYLIATRQGISIESFGPARIETMVVNLADVFEAYVRQVIRENVDAVLTGSILRDGNRYQVPLFTQGSKYKVKPDIYLEKTGTAPVVLDAKYKPVLKSADRYEIIAFCEALQSKLAIFLSPSEPGKAGTTFFGRTPGGIELHEVRIDLAVEDIFVEEQQFLARLNSIVSSAAAQPSRARETQH